MIDFIIEGLWASCLSLWVHAPCEREWGSSRARSQTCDNALLSIQINDIMKHNCMIYLLLKER